MQVREFLVCTSIDNEAVGGEAILLNDRPGDSHQVSQESGFWVQVYQRRHRLAGQQKHMKGVCWARVEESQQMIGLPQVFDWQGKREVCEHPGE